MTAVSSVRLEARITPELQELLQRAAQIQGRSLSDFVVVAVRAAAQQAIEEAEAVRLSLADQRVFAEALMTPPKASAALHRALGRRTKLLRPE